MNYYIEGDAANAEKIRAAFESKGIRVPHFRSCGDSSLIYFSLNKEVLAVTNKALELFEDNHDYKELELPKPHYDISNFYAGMPVLVRADNDLRWDYSVFSRITGNEDWPFAVCNGVSFTQCIPFEGNEHLLGTTDMPSEEYINW